MTVLCGKCTYLFCLKRLPPLCVASAIPVPGPLRGLVDVTGVVLAEVRNENNDCLLFKRRIFIDSSRWIKRALKDIMSSKGVEAKPSSLKEYAIGEERKRKEASSLGRAGEDKEGEEAKPQSEELGGSELECPEPEETKDGNSSLSFDLPTPDLSSQEEGSDRGVGDHSEVVETESGDGHRDDLSGDHDSRREKRTSTDSGLDLHVGVPRSHRPRKDSS